MRTFTKIGRPNQYSIQVAWVIVKGDGQDSETVVETVRRQHPLHEPFQFILVSFKDFYTWVLVREVFIPCSHSLSEGTLVVQRFELYDSLAQLAGEHDLEMILELLKETFWIRLLFTAEVKMVLLAPIYIATAALLKSTSACSPLLKKI